MAVDATEDGGGTSPGRQRGTPLRVVAATAGVLVCFAANQLLARAALGTFRADPLAFTAVRLASGAIALAALARARGGRIAGGSWAGAILLSAYAVAYALAYVRVGAGVGSLVQFAAVQVTMLGWIVFRGARLRAVQWTGVGVALAGLSGLSSGRAHDLAGALWMVAAGIAWGAYSLQGRGGRDPLASTADNFARTVPLAAALALAAGATSFARLGAAGLALAIGSGAIASGVGYALWYAVLPALGTARAAAIQLAVPVVAAAGGAALLGERITPRVVASAIAILAGVAASAATPPRRPGTG